MLLKSIHDFKPNIIATRTQNPRVYETFQKLGDKIYPDLGFISEIPDIIIEIAKSMFPSLKDIRKFIMPNAYKGEKLNKTTYLSKNTNVLSFFKKNLGKDDAILVFVELKNK